MFKTINEILKGSVGKPHHDAKQVRSAGETNLRKVPGVPRGKVPSRENPNPGKYPLAKVPAAHNQVSTTAATAAPKQFKAFGMSEDGAVMSAGTGGFSNKSDPKGPVAGVDLPLLGKPLRRKKPAMMESLLGFRKYLSESSILLAEAKAESVNSTNDDKGKLHELLLAKHLHPDSKNPELPSHHRSENEEYGGTPKQVHDRLKDKLGSDAYNEIDKHAKKTAEAVKKHIGNDHEITNVHWTSNRDTANKKGDHEKTTGVKDTNSNADIIVTSRHKKTGKIHYHPISAKYGTQAQPNFKNAGLDSMEKQVGAKKGAISKHSDAHNARMKKLGYKGTQAANHKQWKEDRDSSDPKKRAKAVKAVQSSLEARKAMAREHESHLSGKSDSELREHIRNNVSPSTHHPHILAHSHVHSDSSSTASVQDASHVSDNHLNNYEKLHAKKGTGITSEIWGTHKKTGKLKKVAEQIFKGTSGPQKGIAGAFKLGT